MFVCPAGAVGMKMIQFELFSKGGCTVHTNTNTVWEPEISGNVKMQRLDDFIVGNYDRETTFGQFWLDCICWNFECFVYYRKQNQVRVGLNYVMKVTNTLIHIVCI